MPLSPSFQKAIAAFPRALLKALTGLLCASIGFYLGVNLFVFGVEFFVRGLASADRDGFFLTMITAPGAAAAALLILGSPVIIMPVIAFLSMRGRAKHRRRETPPN